MGGGGGGVWSRDRCPVSPVGSEASATPLPRTPASGFLDRSARTSSLGSHKLLETPQCAQRADQLTRGVSPGGCDREGRAPLGEGGRCSCHGTAQTRVLALVAPHVLASGRPWSWSLCLWRP